MSDEPRRTFESALGFALDPFQIRGFDALDADQSVVVAAPTGSGKTVIGEYAVSRALGAGAKAFYTTPLKALSNQKYGDLVRAYGPGGAGLLTGDNAIDPDAPVVVMTTEVLRNMIYAGSPTLAGLRYVILDEVHYLQNRYRGAVWEEVIIHLPADVRLVCLSATVSNAEELGEWIRTVRGDTAVVIEEHRPVALTHLYAVAERGGVSAELLPMFVAGPDGEPRPNPDAQRLDRGSRGARDSRGVRSPSGGSRPHYGGRLRPPRREDVVERLADEAMLPAIFFIFSRAACDDAVRQCLRAGLRLTTPEERRAIRAIAERHVEVLDDDDLDALGYGEWLSGLEAGLAAHHAGMVPPLKEAVEESFAAGHVKVVFATETLSLGINMPARTVVIEKLSKFTGEHHELLTPGEYTQLTGRAGRRGLDERGHAVVCWSPWVDFEQVAALASRRTYELVSSFRPTYNMAANLIARYDPDVAHRLLNRSFAQFRADREIVVLERALEADRAALERASASARCERGDVGEYRARRAVVDELRRAGRRDRRAREPFDLLHPGDVLLLRARGRRGRERAVVLRHEHGRGGSRLLALIADRSLVRLGPEDLTGAGHPVARIDLPHPFAPRNAGFRREAADALRRLHIPRGPEAGRERPGRSEDTLAAARAAVAAHPVDACPDRDAHLRASTAVERLTRDVARRERHLQTRDESLARQLDRVLTVMAAWRYVDGWKLTDGGRMLCRLYTETDLLVAEALRAGLFDGLDGPAVAAMGSCVTYERRGPDSARVAAPASWPSRELARRFRELDRLGRDLRTVEAAHDLPESRPPDPGRCDAVHAWASGDTLADVLADDDELTGGDFVRHVKQVVDLLGQIADVAPEAATAAAARAGADACRRGVVAASGLPG